MTFSTKNQFGMTIRESANDGSDFTNPDADYRRLFLGEDGQLHVKDSAGTVTDIGASSGYPTFSGCSLTKSATQAITQNTSTAITFDGEEFDTDAYHNNASNTSRITAPATGYYLFGATAELSGAGDQTNHIVRFRIDGTTVVVGRARIQQSGTSSGSPQLVKVIPLTAAQYVELMVEHSDPAADVRETTNGTSFWAYRVA